MATRCFWPPLSWVGRQRGDVASVQEQAAGVGLLESGQEAQERGLAAAAGAEQRKELAGAHAEGDAIHGLDAAKALGDAFEFEKIRHFIR
jgi:hypothetical protein